MAVTRDLDNVLALPASRGLSADIAARLRTAILNGYFGPGERLGEEALASTMGVSRGPVREAFVQLEREGLIVIRRNRGAFVAQLAREDLDELYTLRLAIEQLAIQRTVLYADDGQIAEMQALVDDIARRQSRGIGEQEAAELDLHFHDLIYRAANHRRLLDTWNTLRPQIHILLLNRNVAHGDFREIAAPSHQVIVDAIRDRDEARAVELTLDHLRGSYERVVRGHERRQNDGALAGVPQGAT
jgi:DNA-binding GntR family transcriptional regulator